MSARRDPLIICLERHAKLVIEHSQIAVPASHDRTRRHRLDFLSDDTDIGFVAAVIAKAIEAETVTETSEQVDIVFEGNIRAPSAAASTTASSTSEAASSAPTPAPHSGAVPAGRSTRDPLRGGSARDPLRCGPAPCGRSIGAGRRSFSGG